MEFEDNRKPDGGWGWAVVAGASLINMFSQGLLSIYGLLFAEHLQEMNIETTGASFIANLNLMTINFIGFVTGPLLKVFTTRFVSCLACLLTTLGLLICSISTKLWHVIVGYSIMVGIGLGLLAVTTFVIINTYFDKKKGLAVGISMCGTGIGQMILPQIIRILLDSHGFERTVQVLAALNLLGLFGSSLFRPLKQRIEVPIVIEEKKNFTFFQKLEKNLHLELLRDPKFWNIMIGVGIIYTVAFTNSMIFPYFLQYTVEYSRKDTALCMSVLAAADLINRILLPVFTDKLKNNPYRLLFVFGVVGMLVFRALMAESKELNYMLVFSAGYGISKSAQIINTNLTVANHCKSDQIAYALGLSMVAKAISVMTFGQFVGWLRDYTGSYKICLHALNVYSVFVLILWLFEFICKHCKIKPSDNIIV